MDEMNEILRNRTDQKLRYASLHLSELGAALSSRGTEFERAHQEATLAQLIGAYDALLQELNDLLGCRRRPDDVALGKLRNALKEQGRSSAALTCIYNLREDASSWLRHLLDLRNASSHVGGIPLAFNGSTGVAACRDPSTLRDFPEDANVTLQRWLEAMASLITDTRQIAAAQGAA